MSHPEREGRRRERQWGSARRQPSGQVQQRDVGPEPGRIPLRIDLHLIDAPLSPLPTLLRSLRPKTTSNFEIGSAVEVGSPLASSATAQWAAVMTHPSATIVPVHDVSVAWMNKNRLTVVTYAAQAGAFFST